MENVFRNKSSMNFRHCDLYVNNLTKIVSLFVTQTHTQTNTYLLFSGVRLLYIRITNSVNARQFVKYNRRLAHKQVSTNVNCSQNRPDIYIAIASVLASFATTLMFGLALNVERANYWPNERTVYIYQCYH